MATNEAFQVERTVEGDVPWLAEHMRKADRQEIQATIGNYSPMNVLLEAVRASSYCKTMKLEGHTVAIFGIVKRDFGGSVWLLGTDDIDRHARRFIRTCKRELPGLLAHCAPLFNYIDKRNEKSLRWVRWLGFWLGEAERRGVENRLFVPIVIQRG